ITGIKGKALKEIRKKIQIIFQDPYSSLDPRKNISTLISEPMVIQQVPKSLFKDKMTRAMEFVNLPLSDSFQNKYPDELSGGQRQRVGIARALIIDPEFIIADESVSMLDASIKAGIINLLLELKERKNLTYLFITHELALAYHICDRISVMHRGRIVESGSCSDVIKSPIHPYTRELILSNPPLFPDSGWIKRPQSNTAFTPDSEVGCGFLMRCPKRKKICGEQLSELQDFGGGHLSTCNID
ncbi:MAG: oligopeptide/dipeptide ABC transporter ATP-binding protein, partial [Desulfobacula sp.]